MLKGRRATIADLNKYHKEVNNHERLEFQLQFNKYKPQKKFVTLFLKTREKEVAR